MNRTQLTIGLTGIAALALLATDAGAHHAPQLGRFLQRDPAGYVDGMNAYQQCEGRPAGSLDPDGTVVVLLSGLTRPESDLERIGKALEVAIKSRLTRYGPREVLIRRKRHGGRDAHNFLKKEHAAWRERKTNRCCLEQFIAVGHSDGATAIYTALTDGSFIQGERDDDGVFRGSTPAYLALVDLIRTDFTLRHINRTGSRGEAGIRDTGVYITPPHGTFVEAFAQDSDAGLKGRYVHGAQRNWIVSDRKLLGGINHLNVFNVQEIIDEIAWMGALWYDTHVWFDHNASGASTYTTQGHW